MLIFMQLLTCMYVVGRESLNASICWQTTYRIYRCNFRDFAYGGSTVLTGMSVFVSVELKAVSVFSGACVVTEFVVVVTEGGVVISSPLGSIFTVVLEIS